VSIKVGYVTRETAISLKRNLLMTLAGILTVAVSLFLFGGVLLLSRMVDHGTARWKHGVELEIFLCSRATAQPAGPGGAEPPPKRTPPNTCQAEATQAQIDAVRAELDRSPDVRRYRFLSKEDAFKEAKRIFANDPELLANIDPEGLPVSFRVVPRTAELTEKVAARFENRQGQGIDDVLTAKEQVRRLLAGIRWIRGLFLVIAGVLLASSLFLIVNTIRLATFARRREIQVMKLVGATNWFIRVPFMFEGLVQGAIGAALAFAGVYTLRLILANVIDRSKSLLQAFYVTGADAVTIGVIIIAVGASVGAVGSAIGLRRFLET
jgi:cell division transport system permease protein